MDVIKSDRIMIRTRDSGKPLSEWTDEEDEAFFTCVRFGDQIQKTHATDALENTLHDPDLYKGSGFALKDIEYCNPFQCIINHVSGWTLNTGVAVSVAALTKEILADAVSDAVIRFNVSKEKPLTLWTPVDDKAFIRCAKSSNSIMCGNAWQAFHVALLKKGNKRDYCQIIEAQDRYKNYRDILESRIEDLASVLEEQVILKIDTYDPNYKGKDYSSFCGFVKNWIDNTINIVMKEDTDFDLGSDRKNKYSNSVARAEEFCRAHDVIPTPSNLREVVCIIKGIEDKQKEGKNPYEVGKLPYNYSRFGSDELSIGQIKRVKSNRVMIVHFNTRNNQNNDGLEYQSAVIEPEQEVDQISYNHFISVNSAEAAESEFHMQFLRKLSTNAMDRLPIFYKRVIYAFIEAVTLVNSGDLGDIERTSDITPQNLLDGYNLTLAKEKYLQEHHINIEEIPSIQFWNVMMSISVEGLIDHFCENPVSPKKFVSDILPGLDFATSNTREDIKRLFFSAKRDYYRYAEEEYVGTPVDTRKSRKNIGLRPVADYRDEESFAGPFEDSIVF